MWDKWEEGKKTLLKKLDKLDNFLTQQLNLAYSAMS